MGSIFRTPITSKAILVEKEGRMRLFWFWPLAGLLFIFGAYIYFQDHQAIMLMMSLFALVPLSILVVLELKNGDRDPEALLSWHGGRLYLFEQGKHIRTLYAPHIRHIEMAQGKGCVELLIHMPHEIVCQKIPKLTRAQKLQIQRIVRCLQAELAYNKGTEALTEGSSEVLP